MTLIYGCDKELSEWVSVNLFGEFGCFGEHSKAIGIERNGKLCAAVVYNNYIPKIHIEMSIYSVDRKWATRHNIRELFKYPFTQLGLGRVQATCSAQNEGVISFLKKLGFVQEGYHRKAYFDGNDCLSFSMLKQECRWL